MTREDEEFVSGLKTALYESDCLRREFKFDRARDTMYRYFAFYGGEQTLAHLVKIIYGLLEDRCRFCVCRGDHRPECQCENDE